MKIGLIGHVCIDINSSEHVSYTGWGSPLMYMGHYFREQLDIDPVLIAPYGRDFQEYAKDVTLLPEPQGDRTLIYRNHTVHDHRSQHCANTEAAEPVALTDGLKKHVAEADIICMAPLLPNFPAEYVKDLLAFRKLGSIAVLSPQGYMRTVEPDGTVRPRDFTEAAEIIPQFNLVVLSQEDCPNALRTVQDWSRMASATKIIVTQGPDGANLVTADSIGSVPTDPIPEEQIVDSVGCGDVFTAAAMYSYHADRDLLVAIAAGNQAARAKLLHASSA